MKEIKTQLDLQHELAYNDGMLKLANGDTLSIETLIENTVRKSIDELKNRISRGL